MLEQISDFDDSSPKAWVSYSARKKRRRSSFRFSSKRVLDRSKLKRLAKARGCDVTRTLSYPSLMPSEVVASDFYGCEATSCKSPDLLTVQELEEERKETANVDHIKDSETLKMVSIFSSFLIRYYY